VRLKGIEGQLKNYNGGSMRVLTIFTALGLTFGGLSLLFADRADAAYSDGGPIVLGNFSQGAYGSGIDHRDAPREEPRRSVRTAALAPTRTEGGDNRP
jgi:hypothetical protein